MSEERASTLPPRKQQTPVRERCFALSGTGNRTHIIGRSNMSAISPFPIHRKFFILFGILAALPAGQALADTKAAVQIESVTCQQNPSANSQNSGLVSIMTTALANSQASSYLIDASLVTGLLTNTTVTSNGGGKSSGSATGSVQVGVIIDGTFDVNGQYLSGGSYAYPGLLSFDARTQTLRSEEHTSE